MCTPMLAASLFTIAKVWKQPEGPSAGEQLKKMRCIYNGILLSHKKEGNFLHTTTQMDLEDISCFSETGWTEKDQFFNVITYMCNLKK